uniref:Uncharacterized protein n=1 Tax=Ditylenchus dipsaci TaxID=166011 RepID=A0A915EI97_9BILA
MTSSEYAARLLFFLLIVFVIVVIIEMLTGEREDSEYVVLPNSPSETSRSRSIQCRHRSSISSNSNSRHRVLIMSSSIFRILHLRRMSNFKILRLDGQMPRTSLNLVIVEQRSMCILIDSGETLYNIAAIPFWCWLFPFLCVICVCISVACLVCRKKTTSEGCIYKLPCHNQHVPPPNPAYPTPAYAQPPAYPACLQQQPLNPHPAQQQQYGRIRLIRILKISYVNLWLDGRIEKSAP